MDDDNDVSTVSVVLCTYSSDLYEHFVEAAESVLGQTYDHVELVVVVDGDAGLYERVLRAFGDRGDVVVHLNDENVGLSASRNRGVELASGDVVAFIDDDAVADERWIEELISVYGSTDAIAVGGRMAAEWMGDKPAFLPEEYRWLVGVTQPGFAEPGEEVRNTFGSNLSFRRIVLERLDGFDPRVGRREEKALQADETELCSRMLREFGRGVVYNPEAVVYHKVFYWRTRKRWLAKRAFWQGYSKGVMESVIDDIDTRAEAEFLRALVFISLPRRLRTLLTDPSPGGAIQIASLCLLTGLVGMGYLYGTLRTLSTGLDVTSAIE